MKASEFIEQLGSTAKSIVKIALQSRPIKIKRADDTDRPLIILANGPSLRQTIDNHLPLLKKLPTLAVNFAANTPEFQELQPRYYVLADPHFFRGTSDPNVRMLLENLSAVTWPMTLFVDRRYKAEFQKSLQSAGNITIAPFNAVGTEGYASFERMIYSIGLGMPRPRNVLIPSIMIGLALGYRTIYLCGADHSWMRDIRVTEENEVVSGMTHYYKDAQNEVSRARNEYRNYRLHDIIRSYYTAFLSYHKIRAYADSIGATVLNATPGSYIDAFDRSLLPSE